MDNLQIATQELSLDGKTVEPQGGQARTPVSEEAALAALQAFAAIPAIDLVSVEARIFLIGPGVHISVRNNGGKLYASLLPESTNHPTESSPEHALAWAARHAGDAGAATVEVADPSLLRVGRKRFWQSGWMLAALLPIAAIVAYLNFASADSTDLKFVYDPVRLATLQDLVKGEYAFQNGAERILLKIDGSTLGLTIAGANGSDAALLTSACRLGHRTTNGKMVVVLSNGAVFDVDESGTLHFGDETYARTTPDRP